MIEFFPQANFKVERLNTLEVGACFSTIPVGNSGFEIFIVVRYRPNTTLINENEIPAVSLKTGHLFHFSGDFSVYPLDLTVAYSHQSE